jgi:hypothetical protein
MATSRQRSFGRGQIIELFYVSNRVPTGSDVTVFDDAAADILTGTGTTDLATNSWKAWNRLFRCFFAEECRYSVKADKLFMSPVLCR